MGHATEISFGMTCRGDAALAEQAVRRLREAYPQAQVWLVTDGDDDAAYDAIAARHGSHLVRGEQLFAQAAGGAYWLRFLALWRQRPTSHFARIDTDTWVHRPLADLPPAEAPVLFGTLRHDTDFVHLPHIQGGFVGFTRAALEALEGSDALRDPGYQDPAYARAVAICAGHLAERRRTGRLSTDLVLTDVAYRLGLELRDHPEVRSLWFRAEDLAAMQARGEQPVGPEAMARFAVTHPHKELVAKPGRL